MNSVKFVLDALKNKYKPLTITGETTAEYTKDISDL